MADEEEPQCKVEYLDLPEGAEPEETNWIRRAGKAKVTYPNGHIFEGALHASLCLRSIRVNHLILKKYLPNLV